MVMNLVVIERDASSDVRDASLIVIISGQFSAAVTLMLVGFKVHALPRLFSNLSYRGLLKQAWSRLSGKDSDESSQETRRSKYIKGSPSGYSPEPDDESDDHYQGDALMQPSPVPARAPGAVPARVTSVVYSATPRRLRAVRFFPLPLTFAPYGALSLLI